MLIRKHTDISRFPNLDFKSQQAFFFITLNSVVVFGRCYPALLHETLLDLPLCSGESCFHLNHSQEATSTCHVHSATAGISETQLVSLALILMMSFQFSKQKVLFQMYLLVLLLLPFLGMFSPAPLSFVCLRAQTDFLRLTSSAIY